MVVKKVKSVYPKKSNKSVLTLARKVPGLITRDAGLIHASLIHQQYVEQSLAPTIVECLNLLSSARLNDIHGGSHTIHNLPLSGNCLHEWFRSSLI